MRWILMALLGAHGLLHVMGFAKAFGYADLPQLSQPISHAWGAAWLVAAGLVMTSTAMLGGSSRSYWMVGAVALVTSQAVIFSSWRDAWAGTVPNAILLLVVAHGWLTEGPHSFHAQYLRDADTGLARAITAPVVTEADLARLPDPVQRYLRVTRAVGQPRVQNYRLRFRGRIRSGPDSRWMSFEAEQQSFADEPTRLFLMRARMFGVPVEAFHRSVGGRATMQVTIAGAFPLEDASGAEMDRAETVTLFNDMCLLAPGSLINPGITWEAVDATSARARFTHGGQTIAATLLFNSAGQLVNFVSDDRSRTEAGGRFTPRRFSTPVRDYRDFGPVRIMSFGEARWLLPEGEFTYGEFNLVDIDYNVSGHRRRRSMTRLERVQPHPERKSSVLVTIKLLHTAVWLFFAGCIVAIPIAGALRHFSWAAVLTGLVLVECIVLMANQGRCPLTDLAGHYTEQRTANFDIYLPLWLARHNKIIFGALFVGGGLFVLGRWLTS